LEDEFLTEKILLIEQELKLRPTNRIMKLKSVGMYNINSKRFIFEVLTDRIAQYVHTYTLYYEYRPFGASSIIASYDEFDGYSLYMIEPSGQYLVYLSDFILYLGLLWMC
jgi:hypothetical protein